MSRDLFFAVGQFSLDGLEDTDLCLKATARSLCSRYVPAATVYHHGSVTLCNSGSGSFPVTSAIGFNQRWGYRTIAWDDYRWYIEDGIWPCPPGDLSLGTSIQRAEHSMSELMEAYKLRDQAEFEGALQRVKAAFSAWPRNPVALSLQCQILEQTGRIPEVLSEIVRFGDFSFCRGPVLLELVQLVERIA